MKYTGERLVLESEECAPSTLIFKEHVERYLFASNYVKNKVVLDVACGVGYGSEILLSQGKADFVFGGDISKEAVEYAKIKYGSIPKINFSIQDAQNLKIEDNSIDVVVSFETIEHLPDVKKYLSEIFRVLKKGGVFIVSTPNKNVTHSETLNVENPFHFQEFSKEEFLGILGDYYTSIDLYYQRIYDPSPVSTVIKSISVYKSIYRKIVPRFIRVNLRNYLFPDLSTDIKVYPDKKGVRPLNYIAICKKEK